MKQRLLKLEVENFLSLRRIMLPLRGLNVLVGPNGAGKTNVLEVFRFLADVIRQHLALIIEWQGVYPIRVSAFNPYACVISERDAIAHDAAPMTWRR